MRIVTFGELMLRLSPRGCKRLIQADELEINYGGGEANVAVSLANFGEQAAFVTKLPENAWGHGAVNFLRRYGVDISHVTRGGNRIGIYFLERGADIRSSEVLYDRSCSAISQIEGDEFDWDTILKGADWFHFTGITPALGKNLSAACMEVLKVCRKNQISVSLDLNYRQKLWNHEQAGRTLAEMLPYVDLCIANDEHIPLLFEGVECERNAEGNLTPHCCEQLARFLCNRYGIGKVALTQRHSLNSVVNEWRGFLFDDNGFFQSPVHTIDIVDRVGGGDAFAAGLIYAVLHGFSGQKAIDFAITAGVLKHSIEGDVNLVSVDEVVKVMNGASGEVQR